MGNAGLKKTGGPFGSSSARRAQSLIPLRFEGVHPRGGGEGEEGGERRGGKDQNGNVVSRL